MQDFQPASDNSGVLIARPKHRIQVLHHGHLLTASDDVLVLRRQGEPDRHFFPLQGVGLESLVETTYERDIEGIGRARFFTLNRDRSIIEHAAWTFVDVKPGLEDLKGMVTFDLDVVTIEEDDSTDKMWDAEAQRMSDYIRHTDSGSGISQADHWQPNVGVASENLGEDEQADERGDEDVFSRGART
jgi:uncharacterized protein (DUF427 family)